MHAFKTTVDCEKLDSYAFGELKNNLYNVVQTAAGSNYNLVEDGRAPFEVEIELLNLHEIDDNLLKDIISSLPNLNKNSDYEVYDGISYTVKLDLYKFRYSYLVREITRMIHAKGGKVEVFTSERLTNEESKDLFSAEFYIEYN